MAAERGWHHELAIGGLLAFPSTLRLQIHESPRSTRCNRVSEIHVVPAALREPGAQPGAGLQRGPAEPSVPQLGQPDWKGLESRLGLRHWVTVLSHWAANIQDCLERSQELSALSALRAIQLPWGRQKPPALALDAILEMGWQACAPVRGPALALRCWAHCAVGQLGQIVRSCQGQCEAKSKAKARVTRLMLAPIYEPRESVTRPQGVAANSGEAMNLLSIAGRFSEI